MGDRIFQKKLSVLSGSANYDLTPIPSGKVFILRSIGISDVNNGDNKSSEFEIHFGTLGDFVQIRRLTCQGTTVEIKVNQKLVGDGNKFIRVYLKNNSLLSKDLSYWLVGTEIDRSV